MARAKPATIMPSAEPEARVAALAVEVGEGEPEVAEPDALPEVEVAPAELEPLPLALEEPALDEPALEEPAPLLVEVVPGDKRRTVRYEGKRLEVDF